jgi:hypothetical protein
MNEKRMGLGIRDNIMIEEVMTKVLALMMLGLGSDARGRLVTSLFKDDV